MTAAEFRAEHGDSTTWTDVDFDVHEHLIEADTRKTTPVRPEPKEAK